MLRERLDACLYKTPFQLPFKKWGAFIWKTLRPLSPWKWATLEQHCYAIKHLAKFKRYRYSFYLYLYLWSLYGANFQALFETFSMTAIFYFIWINKCVNYD